MNSHRKPHSRTLQRGRTEVTGQRGLLRRRALAGFLFRRETGRFNGESFLEFQKQFREASPVAGRCVIAISDNAQYHRSKFHLSWRQHQERQFRLDFLPPYRPDLNPIERVRKLTRRLCPHNRYFGFLDGVVDAVEEQFADWIRPNEALRRLCATI